MIRGNFKRGREGGVLKFKGGEGCMGRTVMKEKCTALIRFTGARNKEPELTNYPPSTNGCLFRVSVPLT